MLNFKIVKGKKTGETFIETNSSGKPLLTTPQLNKGTAFTQEERLAFNLIGKLPVQIETLDDQVKRAYAQFCVFDTQMQKNIYLSNLHDTNQVCFYKLVSQYLTEMLPLIYTPIIGTAVKQFSQEFRKTRGLYISYADQDNIDTILDNRSNPEIDLIVITDGEGVLGLGDQGIGGMDIPIAKLMVYTLCGGINPMKTLPIFLDVGTNNQKLLADPMYLGLRHKRLSGQAYDDFIAKFVAAVKRKFPSIFLHWEDFGRGNATRILKTYQHEICTFNDDIQGTGAVTLSVLLAAINVTQTSLTEQRLIIFGAGSAGTGIADLICDAMVKLGLTQSQAQQRFWLLDRQGLLFDDDANLTPGQSPYAKSRDTIKTWQIDDPHYITLHETIAHVHPTILIGCSAVKGAFNQAVVKEMAKHIERPIILPLSNPTDKSEALPQDLLSWTNGRTLIATGTAFPDVNYQGNTIAISQCNNALVFPGIGLGILAVGATRLTEHMLWRASQALTDYTASIQDKGDRLLPTLDNTQAVAKHIAHAVAQQAISEQLATKNQHRDLTEVIEAIFWEPVYFPYRRI